MHVSNLYRIPEAERLAARLCAASFADIVFFCNSGAEAMECAIKMRAQVSTSANGQPERYRIITFEGAFHGRTLATLAAGGQKKYLEGFGPVVEGFDQVPFGDLEAVKRAIGPETAAILIEPIQGEGGVRVVAARVPARAARALRRARPAARCSTRCRPAWAAPASCSPISGPASTPDIMALAKALGGGFPLGACLATAEAGKGMTAGTHGSTFGGNPLAMAAGNAVLDVMLARRLPRRVQPHRRCCSSSGSPRSRIAIPTVIAEVRGEGLLLGLRAVVPNGELVDALRAEKLLTVAAGDNVVRLLPPLIVTEAEIAEAVAAARARLRPARAGAARRRAAGGGRMSAHGVRHFLDLIDIPGDELRGMIEASRAMKAQRKRERHGRHGRSPARRWR